MEWYVVHTFSGYENSVKRALEDRIKGKPIADLFGDIVVPSEQVTERRGKKTVKTNRKLIPGYLFVNMELTKETWHLVKNTPKVTGFLGGNTPRAVPASEMARTLGQTVPEAEVPQVLPDVTYNVGDHVRVKSGPFANFTGEVEDVDRDKRKVKMSVSIFGRPTPVTVDFAEVELVAS
ncbi:MAG: transcription termination/antitermination protein NusG [Nannocystaceae bacterium]|jgi:transcriptional antiterminator NusG|nr:transcription termination/antitermination protein NusG [Nannocystaceae bacterium]